LKQDEFVGIALPYGWLIFYMLTISLFFFSGRYRAPIMPVAILLASVGLSVLIQRARRTNARRRVVVLAVSSVVAVFILSGSQDAVSAGPSDGSPTGLIERQQGLVLYNQGKYPDAEQWYRKSLAIREDPITRGDLANALKAQGKIDEAEKQYRQVLELDPRAAVTWYNLGNLYRDYRHDATGAAHCYLKAIEYQPQFPNPYLTLALVYHHEGRYDQSLSMIDQGLQHIARSETSISGSLMQLRDQILSAK
jgi:tetratricopeptide (TPR) repeat protein